MRRFRLVSCMALALLPLCVLPSPLVRRSCFIPGTAFRALGTLGRWAAPYGSNRRAKLSRPMVVSTFIREKKDFSRSDDNGRHQARVPTASPEMYKLPLTEAEERLFETLLTMVSDEGLGTTLRVAGGWVRDKILGQRAADGKVDIDITLDDMMGSEFAAAFNKWLAKRGQKAYNVAIISRNPEKSKHLETATMKVGEFWIDFVNLRTEAYTESSRIPSMDIGGPEEDAFRRDLTINSLFYNVNTGAVEDYVGRGMEDIRNQIIRTPLPALTTLLDDPLRVLRAVRFASRLGFRISPELVEAASDSRVHSALANKVSRERIGSEIDLMMRSSHPARAMTILHSFGLSSTVFDIPQCDVVPDTHINPKWFDLGLKALTEMSTALRSHTAWHLSPEDARLCLYSALLLPLARAECREAPNKSKTIPLSRHMFARMLKQKAKDAEKMGLLHEVVYGFCDYLGPQAQHLDQVEKRVGVGFLILRSGGLWRAALLLAAVRLHVEGPQEPNWSYREAAIELSSYVRQAGLDGIWEVPPVYDGQALRDVLPSLPFGPAFREVIDVQTDLTLRFPGIGQEEMKDRLQHMFPAYMAPAADGTIAKPEGNKGRKR